MLFSLKQRGVAQLASAPVWGTGGHRFESGHPDKEKFYEKFKRIFTRFKKQNYKQ